MNEEKRFGTAGQNFGRAADEPEEKKNSTSAASRARNRTVMLTPEMTGQVRALLYQDPEEEAAAAHSGGSADALPSLDWSRPGQDVSVPEEEIEADSGDSFGGDISADREKGRRSGSTSKIDVSQFAEALDMRQEAKADSGSGFPNVAAPAAPSGIGHVSSNPPTSHGLGLGGSIPSGGGGLGLGLGGIGASQGETRPARGGTSSAINSLQPAFSVNSSTPAPAAPTVRPGPAATAARPPAAGTGAPVAKAGSVIQAAKPAATKIVGFLVSMDKDKNGEVYEIRAGRWVLTSRPTDHGDYILINDESISPLHAIIRATKDGKIQVLDQLSEHGSGVISVGSDEEEDAAGSTVTVEHGDTVRFGARYFTVCMIPAIRHIATSEE